MLGWQNSGSEQNFGSTVVGILKFACTTCNLAVSTCQFTCLVYENSHILYDISQVVAVNLQTLTKMFFAHISFSRSV